MLCCLLKKKLIENPNWYSNIDSIQVPSVPSVIVERKNVIMDNILQYQLMIITGVSSNTAQEVVELYPTVSKLIQAFTENGPLLLQNIVMSGGKRKIGKVLSKRIHDVYMT